MFMPSVFLLWDLVTVAEIHLQVVPTMRYRQVKKRNISGRYHRTPDPFSVNSPQRQNSSFQPSLGYQFAPSQQQLPSQGSVNPARTSPPPQYTRVTEGAMYEFGSIPDPNNGTGKFGSSESGGQSLGGPVVDGRRRDTSFSESKAGPSRFQDQPPMARNTTTNTAGPVFKVKPPVRERGYFNSTVRMCLITSRNSYLPFHSSCSP